MIRNIDLKEVDWPGIKERLPVGDTQEDIDKRKKLWQDFDPN
jgi:hypothetical protein